MRQTHPRSEIPPRRSDAALAIIGAFLARDLSTAAVPSHFHGSRKRVSARGSTGATSGVSVHALPPSVDTSTFRIVPWPDHAMPEI